MHVYTCLQLHVSELWFIDFIMKEESSQDTTEKGELQLWKESSDLRYDGRDKGKERQHGHNHQGHFPADGEGHNEPSDEGAEVGEEDSHLVSYT